MNISKLLLSLLLLPACLKCASSASESVSAVATEETSLNALEEDAKKGSTAAALAILDFYKSVNDKHYKITWESSIKLLGKLSLVEVLTVNKQTYARVHNATRDAYKAIAAAKK